MTKPRKIIVVSPKKDVGMAVLLAFIFGPVGLFYASVWGGFIMLTLGLASIPISFLTFGIPISVIWLISIIWAGVAASRANKKA